MGKNIVYILGAGVNQSVNDWDGLKPPLSTNFFQTILKNNKYSNYYPESINDLYGYIEKYWRKTKSDLLTQPFDLEECFTFIESQYYEAESKGNKNRAKELATINFKLKTLLSEFLSEFDIFSFSSNPLKEFASRIYKEKQSIITFNYDCILEDAIQSASGVCQQIPASFLQSSTITGELSDDILAYSHCNWNSPLGYGLRFDEIQLQQAGVSKCVDGDRFYSHPKNKMYDWSILKLHGSLNWVRYLQPLHQIFEQNLAQDKRDNVILMKGHWHLGMPPMKNEWFVDPLIITPQLYKDKYYQFELFANIWGQAKELLEKCSCLIIIGYSLPPTDFAFKKMILESFENRELDKLIIVNPDTSVVKKIKELVHFKKPVLAYNDLEEFLKYDFT